MTTYKPELNSSMKGKDWAEQFLDQPEIRRSDPHTVLSWFANALETGRSAGYAQAKKELNPSWPAPLCPDDRIEELCIVMHLAYEEAAVQNNWSTQERSRKPWADVPEENKATMRTAVESLLMYIDKVPNLFQSNDSYSGKKIAD